MMMVLAQSMTAVAQTMTVVAKCKEKKDHRAGTVGDSKTGMKVNTTSNQKKAIG